MSKTEVFLSFKNSDANGNTTKERTMAKELYNALTNRGISVFYSNETLSICGAAQYKTEIDKALDEAVILIAVGASRESLESSWVRYEWDGFFNDVLSGQKEGHLFSYIDDMSPSDLPRTLRQLQTFERRLFTVEKICDYVNNALGKKPSLSVGLDSKQSNSIHQAARSTYSYLSENEAKRLSSQAQLVCENDIKLLTPIIRSLSATRPINILDVGCADGFLTRRIFDSFAGSVNCVVGVDRESVCVAKANENAAEYYHYFQMDVESDKLEAELKCAMEKCNIDSFDLVFSALVVHHLVDPTRVLRKLRSFVRKNGHIYIRSCDDDEILAYPDEDNLVKSTLVNSYVIPGMSDRQHGRKLFQEAYKAGYREIRIEPYYVTTAGMDVDEREDLFFDIFFWRKNRYKQLIASNPANPSYLKLFADYCKNYDEIEERFFDPSFYFCVAGPILIAKK